MSRSKLCSCSNPQKTQQLARAYHLRINPLPQILTERASRYRRSRYKRNMALQAVVEKKHHCGLFFSVLFWTLDCSFVSLRHFLRRNVQNGIVLASTTLPTSIKQFDQYFTPFIMVKHLGDLPFPSGLVEIILLGLVIGTLVYLFNTVYENINHVVANIIRKTPLVPASKKTQNNLWL